MVNNMFFQFFKFCLYMSNLIEKCKIFSYNLELSDIDCVLITEELNNERFTKIISYGKDKSIKVRVTERNDSDPKWVLSNNQRKSFL